MGKRTWKSTGLSKSRLIQGLQCPKRLYYSVHHPDLAPPVSLSRQAVFDRGHEVGREAQKLFPGGTLIDAPHSEGERALHDTARAIARGDLILYEAAFRHHGVWVRVDILHRDEVGAPWELIEVKSTTGVKETHLQDAGIQYWVVTGSGQKVSSVSILHLNGEFVYPDGGELFTRVEVTDRLDVSDLPARVAELREMLGRGEVPDQEIGPHCGAPTVCSFKAHCYRERGIPAVSVFDIPSLSADRKWEYYRQGILELTDPRLKGERFSETQSRMLAVARNGERFVDGEGIREALSEWEHPLYFLDFETVAFALPRYEGTQPYQQLPFQFSCHVIAEPGGEVLHGEYLHDTDDDPRRELAAHLVRVIGAKGSVVAYSRSFEGQVLDDLARVVPEYGVELLSMKERLVDPLPIVRACVYDAGFAGSFSIKAVAPALFGGGMDYSGMAVSNGQEAQVAYQRLISGGLAESEREELRRQMLEYCRKDTEAMVELVGWMGNQ